MCGLFRRTHLETHTHTHIHNRFINNTCTTGLFTFLSGQLFARDGLLLFLFAIGHLLISRCVAHALSVLGLFLCFVLRSSCFFSGFEFFPLLVTQPSIAFGNTIKIIRKKFMICLVEPSSKIFSVFFQGYQDTLTAYGCSSIHTHTYKYVYVCLYHHSLFFQFLVKMILHLSCQPEILFVKSFKPPF